jgi:hypothetical protein
MELSAIAKAEKLFSEHYPDTPFVVQLATYLRYGFVINYPETFIMFRPVEHNGKKSYITDPSFKFLKPDTWYIDLLVGNLSDAVKLMPHRLKYLCFFRKFRKQLKFYKAERFLKLCTLAHS